MITADQLRRRTLSSSCRSDGYDRSQVDHYMELAAATLSAIEEGRPGANAAATMLLREVRDARFGARRSGAGYASAEVEALRSGVVAALEAYVGAAPASTDPRSPASLPAAGETVAPTPAQQPTRTTWSVPAAPAATAAAGTLSAFDLIMRVQSGRTTLMASRGERIVVRTSSGTLHAIESVEATPDGVLLTLA
ncbi:hypothetical protein [Cellulomonas chengniuliangii]|uniref:DivIVA domain-containing protein n=1 Tax=Cellulomonas chengniuliangii TaxID=2968084 RepID=A0ABY5L073_9CELL|nr:hypothetical protein [Cellulomonas chengniuliangii]MCC2307765.1 hypothetical protein [Cellulomonas chengniuliangii]UUI75478.1 hypothetical protein NP064_00655 [Cellulomonas chengniuliangii]